MWNKLTLFCSYMRHLNRENSIFSLSAEAAYYLILNAVPFLMLLLNITFLVMAPYSSAIKSALMSLPPGLEAAAIRYADELALIHQIINALPYDLSKVINDRIDIIVASRMQEISVAGAISLAFTAWASTQGIAVLVQAADPENYLSRYAPVLRYSKAWLIVRFKAALFAIGMVGLIGLSFFLMLSGNLIFYSLHFIAEDYPVLEIITRAPLYLWNLILYAVPFVLLLVILTMFYRYAPSRFNRHGWGRSFYMGLAVAVLWMVSAAGYSYYMENYSLLGPLYGSLFGIVLLIVWLRVIAALIVGGGYLLLAYENAVEEKLSEKEAELPPGEAGEPPAPETGEPEKPPAPEAEKTEKPSSPETEE